MNSQDDTLSQAFSKTDVQNQGSTQAERDPKFKFKATAFLASVAGVSALFGFGATLSYVKKKDPTFFDKGVAMGPTVSQSGAALALRALGWGTVYAVGGCGLLFFSLWKLSGCKNLYEFRMKMGEKLPKISKNDPPQSRTEFDGLSDLMRYLETWGSESKQSEGKSQSTVEAKSSSSQS